MLVQCPACGVHFRTKGPGRYQNPKHLTSEGVIKSLRKTKSVAQTARNLHVSEKRLYEMFKPWGIEPRVITGRKYTRRVQA